MMRAVLNGLTDREKEILVLRERKVPYKTIAARYDISPNRVRQIYVDASKKLRSAQKRLLAEEANQTIVLTPLTRADLIIISEALRSLQSARMNTVTHTLGNLRAVIDEDPLYRKAEAILEKVDKLVKNTSTEVTNTIESKLADAVAESLSELANEQ